MSAGLTARTRHLLGSTPAGDRVWVEIELEPVGRHVEFTDHTHGILHHELSITGDAHEIAKREPFASGQIIDFAAAVDAPAPGWSHADVMSLLEIWQKWHLNAMHPASAEQTNAGISYEHHRGHKDSTGYLIGSKWLARQIPHEVLEEIRRLQTLPTGLPPAK